MRARIWKGLSAALFSALLVAGLASAGVGPFSPQVAVAQGSGCENGQALEITATKTICHNGGCCLAVCCECGLTVC